MMDIFEIVLDWILLYPYWFVIAVFVIILLVVITLRYVGLDIRSFIKWPTPTPTPTPTPSPTPMDNPSEEFKTVVSKPNPDLPSDARISYSIPSLFNQNYPYQYAYCKMPVKQSWIKFPRHGSGGKKGFKERDFYRELIQHFTQYEIHADMHVVTTLTSNPYEPDIVLKDRSNKHILIDIEIDEPYDLSSRVPTHCLGRDNKRDDFFSRRGWVVVRFTEYQIVTQINECCAFIANVIESIDSTFSYPKTLLKFRNKLENKQQWDKIQSKIWEKEYYREKYLGIDLNVIHEPMSSKINWEIEKSENEVRVEINIKSTVNDPPYLDENQVRTVSPSKKLEGKQAKQKLEKVNGHNRDSLLMFDEEEHKYSLEDFNLTSVSEIIGQFYTQKEFDPVKTVEDNYDKWQEDPMHKNYNHKGLSVEAHQTEIFNDWEIKNKSSELGTLLHNKIEAFYNDEEYVVEKEISNEWEYFLSFNRGLVEKANPYRSEWRIFDEDLQVAGTVDMIFKKKDKDEYFMVDWKRSVKIIDSLGNVRRHPHGAGAGFFSIPNFYNKEVNNEYAEEENLPYNSYNEYCLQQSLYKYILESRYGIEIKSIYLLILHPKYKSFVLLQNLPYMLKEVIYMLQNKLKK